MISFGLHKYAISYLLKILLVLHT